MLSGDGRAPRPPLARAPTSKGSGGAPSAQAQRLGRTRAALLYDGAPAFPASATARCRTPGAAPPPRDAGSKYVQNHHMCHIHP